jgi:hypothetical protein
MGVTAASNLHNPTLRKKNENKKIDNSQPNEFYSNKLPNRCVTSSWVHQETFAPGGPPDECVPNPFSLGGRRNFIR